MKKENKNQFELLKDFQSSLMDKYDCNLYLSKAGEVVFLLDEFSDNEKVKNIPEEIALPNGVLAKTVIETGSVMPLGSYISKLSYIDCGDPSNAVANQTKQRPIKCGTSIIAEQFIERDEKAFGTLGAIVVDNTDGSLCALTNAHVVCDDPFIPSIPGKVDRDPTKLLSSNLIGKKVYQGTESNGIKSYKDSDSIGIIKRWNPFGAKGAVDVSQTATPIWRHFGGTDDKGRPRIRCDAALIALKESVVDANSWQQLGISSQGGSAPQFATYAEYVQLAYDSDWGKFATDVGGGNSGRPKMVISSRTTGPKEGDPEIEYIAMMQDINVPFASNQDAAGFRNTRCIDVFSFGLVKDSNSDTEICQDATLGGDSGSTVWAEINGTWKIVGLVFAAWGDRKTGNSNMGFAFPMPTVAQIMNISAWDGNLAGSKFLDDNGEFTTRTAVTQGLSQNGSFVSGSHTFFLGGTELGSRSTQDVVEKEYRLDHNNSSLLANYIQNDWLSQAANNQHAEYEARLYVKANNNPLNEGNPVTEYTYLCNTGTYVLSTNPLVSFKSPWSGQWDLQNTADIQKVLDISGLFAISGCDSEGDIANKKAETLAGEEITWQDGDPGINNSYFQTGINNTVYSVNGHLKIPGAFDKFYISIPSQPEYKPLKFKYSELTPAGFDANNVFALKPYIAALSHKSTAGNIFFDNNGFGMTVHTMGAHLIYPIFKWSDIQAKGLEGHAARYGLANGYATEDPDWDHYEGYQMGRNPADIKQHSHLGVGTVNSSSAARYYKQSVHKIPTLIPLSCLEVPNVTNYTGYAEYGRANDGVYSSSSQLAPRMTSGGWVGDMLYGGGDQFDHTSGSHRTRIFSSEGRFSDAYGGDLIYNKIGGDSIFNKNNGYVSNLYVLNPLWVEGRRQYLKAWNIPEDSELSTPYGHEFAPNTALAAGTSKYSEHTIDSKLNHLPLLDAQFEYYDVGHQAVTATYDFNLSFVGF